MEMEEFLPDKKIDKKTNSLSKLLKSRNILVITVLLSIVLGGWMTWLTLDVGKESLSEETDIDFAGIYKLYSRKIFKRLMSSRFFSLKDWNSIFQYYEADKFIFYLFNLEKIGN